jgi:cystathionine gamma-synthase/methionine-gamma-lyase
LPTPPRDIKGDEKTHQKFQDSLHLITRAVFLGNSESLIVYYGKSSDKLPHYPKIYQEGFFHFSVGLEAAEDAITDLKQTLEACNVL